jgi:undecaprenyl-diphosphatase
VAVALVGVLRRAEPVHLLVDGRERRLWLGFIGNCRYRPSGFAPTWRTVLDDRQLDIRLVDAELPFARIRLVLSVLTGRLGRSTVYEQRCAPTLELESHEGPISIALDGEVCEVAAKVTVGKRDRPVDVFAPHR